ncbi:Histidine kinase [Rubrivivax sp. A210]|uniref:sensor histidine kinase n=1 Tax=Rubrivivax sp. A210 TaxID=2772301 RepID=UPI00191882A8|nr:ATP-binding protein [Rubrivivax sp. A210]CAD5374170.1 Histidine kinase [Rubrivivax sp. A210]
MDATEADRRQGDRRRRRGRRRDDVAPEDADSGLPAVAESFFDPGWLAAGDGPHEGRGRSEGEGMEAPDPDGALARVYRTYATARAAIGVGLVGVQGVGALIGTRSSEWLTLVSLVYAVQAFTLWLLPRFLPLGQPWMGTAYRRRHWLATIGVDLAAFMLLHLLEVGSTFNYAALLVLPVLMAGVLTSRLLALGTAAGVSLMLLAAALRATFGGATPALMLQSGLAGLGLFIITLLAGELAGRLAREERAARGSRELAHQQAQLNRLVIEEMADGVLVIDGRLQVRAANPAARALLVAQGLAPLAPFTLQGLPAWAALQQAAERALAEGDWPEAGRDILLAFGDGHTRTLRLRVRFMRGRAFGPTAPSGGAAGEPFAVLLLEDLRTLQARIRQEKLAAMGRVSAGIAHEIRNPLAAIAQANALLLEDELNAPQRQLAQMVADNVQRLKRLVDDVMDVAPGAEPLPRAIDAASVVGKAAGDWSHTVQLADGSLARLRTELPAAALAVVFDPDHLRRVLVNLLDNAQRHASGAPGSIFLRLAVRDESWALLSVLSDGAPIAPDVERHLFEPFFSTRSRGSGLGLYICRELCERHGASIEYRPRPAAERLRNEFVVSMRRVAQADARLDTEPG